MRTRLEFREMLQKVTGLPDGHMYFQPPDGTKMKYPAIVYSRDGIYNTNADNRVYEQKVRYAVTVIDSNPDSELVKKISLIPSARFSRHFTSENLNHDLFTITY